MAHMKTVSTYIQRLRSLGWRITAARQAMIEILSAQHKPQSVSTIMEAMEKRKLGPNKTTIYRELERLKDEGIVREVLIDGKSQYFELLDEEDRHHHHLICTNCKCIEDFDPSTDIEDKIDELTSLVSKKSNFGEVSHSVDFFGLCRKCV